MLGALGDVAAYLRGDLLLTFRNSRWLIESPDGQQEVDRVVVPRARGTEKQRAAAIAARSDAEDRLSQWQAIIAAGASPEKFLVERNSQWQIVSPDGRDVGAPLSSRAAAERKLATAREIEADVRSRNVRAIVFALLGFAVGAAGTYSVWQQTRRTPDVIAREGVARTFQNIRLFREMTALENVLVGMDRRISTGLFSMMLRLPNVRRTEDKASERACELLKWMGLGNQQNMLAKNLPYGAQRRLEIARRWRRSRSCSCSTNRPPA